MDTQARLVLQCDWEETLREAGGKAWLSLKRDNHPSVSGEIVASSLSSDGTPYVNVTQPFSVPEISRRTLTVHYSNDDLDCTCRFTAPRITYTGIHAHRKKVASLDVAAGGLGVSADTAGKLLVWETNTGEVRRQLEGHVGDVYTCRLFPSGVVALSAGADTQLKIWSAETGQCAATLTGHKAGVNDTCIVERGRNILSCSSDGSVKLWDCGSQLCLGTISCEAGALNCCAIQNVSRSGLNLGQPSTPLQEREVGTEGKMLLVGGEGKILKAYGLHTRERVFELECHDAVNCCTFLSDVTAVSGTQDGHITVIDIRKPSVPLKEWRESRSAILSLLPYQQGFVTSTGDGSCFYTDELYSAMMEMTGPDCEPVYKVVSDGSTLYTGCRDGYIRCYNVDV